jgi:hypothetical protein
VIIWKPVDEKFIHPKGSMVANPFPQEWNITLQFYFSLNGHKIILIGIPIEGLRWPAEPGVNFNNPALYST